MAIYPASASYCSIEEHGSLEMCLSFRKESALQQKYDLMRISAIQIAMITWGWDEIKNTTRKHRHTSMCKILWLCYSSVFLKVCTGYMINMNA